MPVYEYQCEQCGPFSQLQSLDRSSDPAHCPECGCLSSKLFPRIHLRFMRAENRVAWERNEASAHAPHVCAAGCSHAPAEAKAREPNPDGQPVLQGSMRVNRRPWMLLWLLSGHLLSWSSGLALA